MELLAILNTHRRNAIHANIVSIILQQPINKENFEDVSWSTPDLYIFPHDCPAWLALPPSLYQLRGATCVHKMAGAG